MASTISPDLLRQRLAKNQLTLIDTRDSDSFAAWHIPGARNFPYSSGDDVDREHLETELDVDPDEEIVTICGKGISSYAFADRLADAGFESVTVVQDGMEGWSRVYEVASIPTAATAVEIFQVQRVAKGCLGYVIGASSAHEAVVIDPTRHTDEFRRIAADDGLEITRVIDTHVHADHISGGRELANAVGATYHLPAGAASRDVEYPFTPLERNEVLSVGDVDIKAIATPGHTTESMSLLVGADAILTGDTVFLESVGRTELQFGEAQAAEGAAELFDAIHGSILSLPDGTTVLPGHMPVEDADTLTRLGSPAQTTVGHLRTELDLLQLDRDAFVKRLGSADLEKPPNYERMLEINTGQAEPSDDNEAVELELGPNRCAADT